MSDFPREIRRQLQGKLTAGDLQSALQRDGWAQVKRSGAVLLYVKDGYPPITVHYHPREVYRSWKLIEGILNTARWTVDDLRRLKLISKR